MMLHHFLELSTGFEEDPEASGLLIPNYLNKYHVVSGVARVASMVGLSLARENFAT